MRNLVRLFAVTLTLGACSNDDGAILTFDGPDEGIDARRVQIVLASADETTIESAVRQRRRAGGLGEEDVVYYRQRARGGIVDAVQTLEGFTVRIEPEENAAPDESFIPFALVFDSAGELAAIGTVDNEAGDPTHVIVRDGSRSEYTMTFRPLTLPGPSGALEDDQGVVVGCLDDTDATWLSGVAWKRPEKPQLRLLLADYMADPDNHDATERASDLDCDTFAAVENDCDDLRSAFHPGQDEACDGLDTDCDGARMTIQTCDAPSGTTACANNSGVELCVDNVPGGNVGACLPDPGCVCNSLLGTCAACMISTLAGSAGTRTACAPAIGKIHYPEPCDDDQPGCTIEVVAVTGPFEASISMTETGGFSSRIPSMGFAYVRLKHLEPTFSSPVNAISVGHLYLAITDPIRGRVIPHSVDLQIAEGATTACMPAVMPNNFSMYCVP